MGEGLTSMEGVNQQIRPSRPSNNSPTLQGNSSKSVARPRGGQLKTQRFGKSCPANGQHNAYPNKNKGKSYQNPQRKGYSPDKRPPARGFKQTERFQQLSKEDHEFDLDYDFPVTSRKDPNSLNHLLNFTFAPREQIHHVPASRKKTSWKGSTYNKEQFLQANCQFVVQDGGDYAVNIVDPDVIVDWELIEQVRVRCTEMPSCPICLYPPTAAQMTRCGHIYCWSCILHYLSLSDKTWRKCPICYESIHKQDLKSVMAVSEHKHLHGQEITMILMKRSKGSVLALPKSRWVERDVLPQFASDEVEMQFSKLLIATAQEILDKVMAKVQSELKCQLLEVQCDKSEEEPFVKLAIDEFEKRQQRLVDMCSKEEKDMIENKADTVSCGVVMDDKPVKEKAGEDITSGDDEANESTATVCEDTAEQDAGKNERSRSLISSDDSISSFKSTGSSKFYYFYQAEDGQHIFLHPVNAKCLIKEYGSLENCPESITGRIVEMECHTQTEELRRRFAYFRHLPLTCEFAICELDLKPPVLSRETLNFFKDDMRKRRVRRQKKAKEEAKHENKCRSEMAAFTGIKQPRQNYVETPDLSSEQDFPQQAGCSSDTVWVASSPPTSGPWSSSPVASDKEISLTGPSFAKALSTGKCSHPQAKPKVRTQSESSRTDREKSSENSDEEECDAVPSFQSAFTDALMVADWNLNVEGVGEGKKTEGGSGKRNKRKNKRLLFSTGSAMKL